MDIKIATHHDADGITSAFLFIKTLNEGYEIMYPDIFGDVNDVDVVLDMAPINPKFKGTVYDHHPQHMDNHSYKLIWDAVPTSLIIYRQLKDKIPKEECWKTVVGLVGDAQPELTPPEIWKSCPSLLDMELITSEYKNQLSTFQIPKYKLLSSPVNAACRLGFPDIALKSLIKATKPDDILHDETLLSAKAKLKGIMSGVIKNTNPIDLGHIVLWIYDSSARLSGWLATRIEQSTHKTAVVVNKSTGSMSIRGDLALLVVEKLNKSGIPAGGHPGFSGGNISKDQIGQLPNILRNILR